MRVMGTFCCAQSLQDAEDRAARAEKQASTREQDLQAQVAGLKAETRGREESAAALEARMQEALNSASAAGMDRRRLEAKLQQHSEVRNRVSRQWTRTGVPAPARHSNSSSKEDCSMCGACLTCCSPPSAVPAWRYTVVRPLMLRPRRNCRRLLGLRSP